jgi:hypothetical protein
MPATGDRITKRKDGLFQGMYTAHTPDGPKRKYIYDDGSSFIRLLMQDDGLETQPLKHPSDSHLHPIVVAMHHENPIRQLR